MRLSLVYRGPLASCTYQCRYCVLRAGGARDGGRGDAAALERFVRWVEGRPAGDALSILFAPRGEALVHARYRAALRRLAALPQVRAVAAQTNLDLDPALLAGCDRAKTFLWTTFHPTETTADAFAARSRALVALGLRHSAGAVAIPAHLDRIEGLRRALPPTVYLWLNRRHGGRPLAGGDLARALALDPFYVDRPARSRGLPCAAGSRALFVDGRGDVRRCFAVRARLGNLYAQGPEALAAPEPCPAPVCRCYLGRIHRDPEGERRFGDGLLARVPLHWPPPREAA